MSPKELSALPELPECYIEMLPTGEQVRHRRVLNFVPYKPKPDDVLIFHDEHGSWFVDYHLEGGPYKRRALF